jgi:hypothetical protein
MLAPPDKRRAADRRRQAEQRKRRRNGVRCYSLPLTDRCVERLIVKLILNGRLTEREALQSRHIDRALADLLEEMGRG